MGFHLSRYYTRHSRAFFATRRYKTVTTPDCQQQRSSHTLILKTSLRRTDKRPYTALGCKLYHLKISDGQYITFFLYLDSPYKMVAEKEKEKKRNNTVKLYSTEPPLRTFNYF